MIRFQPASTRENGLPADVNNSSPKNPTTNDRSRRPRVEAGPDPDSDYPVRITVRSVHPSDVFALRGMTTVLALHQPDLAFGGYNPVRAALSSIAPGRAFKPRVFVALANDEAIGFAHFQPMSPDHRWQLIGIGSATGVYEASPVWEELICQSVVAAGLRGVKRLYARAPIESAAAESLVASGFSPYARERVYVGGPLIDRRDVPLRAQEQTDTWAIHQLYNTTVPRQIHFAEAFTSHRWDLRAKPEGQSGVSSSGWLLEDRHQMIGYARIRSKGSVHILELIYSPERTDILDDLLLGALSKIKASGRKERIYCAARGYQEEAASALERNGFTSMLEQELHVKYTTANVRVAQPEAIPFHAEVIEKLPKRVPAFLPGKPQDESAT